MNNDQKKKTEEAKVLSPFDTRVVENPDGTIENVSILIPDCCREGWKTCIHVVQPQRKAKRNVGL